MTLGMLLLAMRYAGHPAEKIAAMRFWMSPLTSGWARLGAGLGATGDPFGRP